MLTRLLSKRILLDWPPSSTLRTWLLALAWWLVLQWPLRRSLRAALGGGAAPWGEPPTRPRRPKNRPRRPHPRLPYPAA